MPKEGDQSASRIDKEHLPGEGYFLRTREELPDPKGAALLLLAWEMNPPPLTVVAQNRSEPR